MYINNAFVLQTITILPSDFYDLPWSWGHLSAATFLHIRSVRIVVDHRDAAVVQPAGLSGAILSPHICGHKSGVIQGF